MMYVNPFWFGVLMTIVSAIIVMIILAIVRSHQEEWEDYEPSEEEFKQALSEMSGGKSFKIYYHDGYMVGEAIEDETDDQTEE